MGYLLAPTYGSPNRVTCIPGYATSSTCKILVATIYDPVANPVTLTVNGVVVSGTLVARGSSPIICWTGAYTASGLPAFSRVSWSVTQTVGGVVYADNGSLMTAPTTRTEKFTLFHASCDNNTRFSNDSGLVPRNVPGYWQYLRAYTKNPILGIMFVDDLGYVDNTWIWDAVVGGTYNFPGMTGLTCSDVPSTSGLLNDYLVSWCASIGMLGPTQTTYPSTSLLDNYLLFVLWGREENRAWCRKNLNVWPQWGDHEYMEDMGWDYQPGGVTINQFNNGKTAYNAFYGAIQPPTAGALDLVANHWAFNIGGVTIATLDGVTNAARVSWAAPAVPNGFATATSATLTQFTAIYGSNQIDDVLSAINTLAGVHTILPMAHSIRYLVARTNSTPPESFTNTVDEFENGAQHPIYDHCLVDYQRLFTRTGANPKSLMDNPLTNGATGCLLIPHGDFHHGQVLKHQRAAYTGNAKEYFWQINSGTVNGSTNFGPSPAGSTGATVADCYVEYTHSAASSFYGGLYEYDGSVVPVIRALLKDLNNITLWEAPFYSRSGNQAFPVNYSFPKYANGSVLTSKFK